MVPPEAVAQAVNPKGEPPYSGPVGSVHGTVRVSGDPAPDVPLSGLVPGKCEEARAFYGKLFREGPDRTLGDVLVAVTEYKGFLPAKGPAKTVTVRGCALESRTIAMVFGQRLEVRNRGGESFVPELLGARQPALIVAMPGGEPVPVYPHQVGQYELKDSSHAFVSADVFVLKYPTVAVTGIDGKFEIRDIPPGDVLVSAHLPRTKKTVSQRVTIVGGEAAQLDLTIPFEPKPADAQPKSP